ncbi:restriction endonuclease subunit S [Neptuniibacter sp. 2_MG-2023]|uniref:restriction endonuclease subunit S n=1 Tax=Neptuniibacter sp. 2_MG-2023 TaxID=3062671 RepID=UPI0026E17A9C|nr:restriction endonuclease subunit S [Neptuniibacter sp. 2_MG-2023]MDO6513587.1 restriction endonuclease subunit S [Neptuniibacter sp. 2_MG-2023]
MGNSLVWEKVSFESLFCAPLRNGVYKKKEFHGHGCKIINMGELFRFSRLTSDVEMKLVDLTEKEKEKSLLNEGDLIFARRSLTAEGAGKCSIVLSVEAPTTFESSIIRVRLNESQANPEFYYYLFNSPIGKWLLGTILRQTAVSGITGSDLAKLEVPRPPKIIQDSIANHCRILDNKIELNRQTNQTLEQMAQALFKSWFVDFDPVIDNALAAGNSIPEELQARAQRRQQQLAKPDHQPLPDDMRQLFPSEFEETEELGWVPKGWEVTDMTQLVDSVSNTYPLKTVDSVIFLNTGDIDAGVFLHSDYSVASSLPGQAKKSIQLGDILYSEIRPKNKRFAYVNFESDEYVVSTKLMVLRSKGVVDSKFAYFVLTLESSINELQSIAELRSGTFPQITFKELSAIKISIPDNQTVLDTFSKLILDNYYNKHFQLQIQNKDLEKLRDTLLPKLISGELRLPESMLDSETKPSVAESAYE